VSEVRTAGHDEALSEDAPRTPGDAFRISLPNFEGPLDLLLHLIREHQVDIFDIPISLITEKYLDYLQRMREINLDIAGEFLVMASTLAHIKSRLLLPRQEVAQQEGAEAEEQNDPRAELVRRLLEYQKYKDAAETIAKQDILDRDVFPRRVSADPIPIPDDEVGLMEISIYKLIEALDRVIKEAAPAYQHEVVRERVSLGEAIRRIAERVRTEQQITFFALFEGQRVRQQIVITFLAMLEMCKLKLIRIFQSEEGGDILIAPKGDALENLNVSTPEVDESEYR
jgi:segregation and condensation protein A